MNQELSSKNINKWCKDLPGFKGCIFKDQIPDNPVQGFWIVLLVDKKDYNSKNGHWVLVYTIPLNGKIWYCDSMGISPPHKILYFMQKFKLEINYLQKELQPLNSVTCGYWACCMAQLLEYVDGIIEIDGNLIELYKKINFSGIYSNNFIQVQDIDDKIIVEIYKKSNSDSRKVIRHGYI